MINFFAWLLILSGDVELNPGPGTGSSRRGLREPKPDKHQILQEKVDAQETRLAELETLTKSQAELIEKLQSAQVQSAERAEKAEVDLAAEVKRVEVLEQDLAAAKEAQVNLKTGLDEAKVNLDEKHDRIQVGLGAKIDRVQTEHKTAFEEVRTELEFLRGRLMDGVDNLGAQGEDTSNKVRELELELEEIQDKLWELDKSWRNNLVFYGLRGLADNDSPQAIEDKVRDIISRNMQIRRDIPILRVKRAWNGPDVRGSKPVTVYFEKWQDKDEIMRKTKFLKGSNIFVGEDFSKKVRDHRAELQKFARLMKKKHPDAKFSLQNDRLFFDKEVFVYNEFSGKVEPASSGSSNTEDLISEAADTLIRKKSSGRRRMRLSKSQSTEDALNAMSDYSLPSSPQKSPRSPVKKFYGNSSSPYESNGANNVEYEQQQQQQQYQMQQQQMQQRPVNQHHRLRNNNNNNPVGGETDPASVRDEEQLVDYNEGGNDGAPNYPSSPVRRLSAVIPETIPE